MRVAFDDIRNFFPTHFTQTTAYNMVRQSIAAIRRYGCRTDRSQQSIENNVTTKTERKYILTLRIKF